MPSDGGCGSSAFSRRQPGLPRRIFSFVGVGFGPRLPIYHGIAKAGMSSWPPRRRPLLPLHFRHRHCEFSKVLPLPGTPHESGMMWSCSAFRLLVFLVLLLNRCLPLWHLMRHCWQTHPSRSHTASLVQVWSNGTPNCLHRFLREVARARRHAVSMEDFDDVLRGRFAPQR